MVVRIFSVFILAVGLLCGPIPSKAVRAADVTAPAVFPEQLRQGLDCLLRLSADRGEPFPCGGQIGALLEFVAAGTPLSLAPETASDGACAYSCFDLKRSLKDVLRIGFSPDIPSHILMPSSVRMAYWTEIDGQPGRQLPPLWPMLEKLETPVVVRGVERVENTPDLNSGAYFAYDLDRTLVLLHHRGRAFLVSVSAQKETSEVGRKGAVIGADSDWNYLYFEEAGLDRPGLGWVRSHMYGGGSVSVYAEIGDGRPLVRCGIFRWLKAGWASINMVRRTHIEEGLKRYAETLCQILEDPKLPDGDTLAAGFARIQGLSDALLADRIRSYYKSLAETCGGRLSSQTRERLKRLITQDPARHLARDRMEALLALQYLKAFLGKPTGPETRGLYNGAYSGGRG